MKQARLHFYAELKDFVAPSASAQNKIIVHNFKRRASIKDVIESYNVPHPEIDLIIVNGVSVDFSYIVQNDDDIHVHPANALIKPISIAPLRHLSPRLSGEPRFIVDVNLGRLARYLRLLGFDSLYRNNFDDKTIAEISGKTQRIVLTRDRKLLQRKIIDYGYFVRAETPKIQVREVLAKFNIYRFFKPLTRCTSCNGDLKQTEKQNITHRLKPMTKKHYAEFSICSDCNQIYWQGSHSARVARLIRDLSKTGNPFS
ncbi:Mut7-C RNAse domain-containing protein [Nitrosomonas sp.]|uniref:Mut7-C RNAse domain-containing protein n=1 Tax=Nitrosomonas sp. TaxID=42353 RepID=UPI00208C71A3|nr:Mut7-C RNAse domain-containing protein [Nitrosomonas sp.]GJL76513.1 MAG: hypothetical protein NMNS02_26190 [Nitrosomonas sp.]